MSVSGTNAENVRKVILNTAKDIGLPKETQGAGLVKVSAAVSSIKKAKDFMQTFDAKLVVSGQLNFLTRDQPMDGVIHQSEV